MAIYYLKAELTLSCADPGEDTDEGFDRFTDAVQDELLRLEGPSEGVVDPDLTVKIVERWAGFCFGITADTPGDAVLLFSADLRSALHATGSKTTQFPIFQPTTEKPEISKADMAA